MVDFSKFSATGGKTRPTTNVGQRRWAGALPGIGAELTGDGAVGVVTALAAGDTAAVARLLPGGAAARRGREWRWGRGRKQRRRRGRWWWRSTLLLLVLPLALLLGR